MGDERFERYLSAFEEEPPVSIRLNPKKAEGLSVADGEQVPWCRGGYYLPQRPNFTMDPLLHAGCYYVQEAASMFLDEVLHQMHNAYVNHQPSAIRPQTALDLCAAPGGKSTLLRSALPGDCVLYSNEPIRNRASILLENVTKWGYENHHVTNCYPRDYRRAKQPFDLILCDVPCSGEGMFRKDPATIREWSPQNVEKCWQLQREMLPIETRPEWNITGSLLQGFDEPVCRFIPGISRGEGLFMCVLRKSGITAHSRRDYGSSSTTLRLTANEITARSEGQFPHIDLNYQEVLKFLRGEALVLPPDTPRGIVAVCFDGHPLGTMKRVAHQDHPRSRHIHPHPDKPSIRHLTSDIIHQTSNIRHHPSDI